MYLMFVYVLVEKTDGGVMIGIIYLRVRKKLFKSFSSLIPLTRYNRRLEAPKPTHGLGSAVEFSAAAVAAPMQQPGAPIAPAVPVIPGQGGHDLESRPAAGDFRP